MYTSKDHRLTIQVAQSLGDTVFPPADFSILNVPLDKDQSFSMFKNLHNSATAKHVSLIFSRYPRKDKMAAIENITSQKELNFLDVVHIWYEKPSASSNIGLLPVAEDAFLFYKGDTPNIKNTAWFASDKDNATNMWGVSPAEYEGRQNTYHKKFAWEIGLILYTMSEPVEHKRIIFGLDSDHEHMIKFAKTYNISVHLIVQNETLARQLLSRYETM